MSKGALRVGFDVTWFQRENMSGGVYQYSLRLMRALVDHTDVSVIAITGDAGCQLPGLEGRRNFRAVNIKNDSLMQFVAREGIDVIHSPVQHFPNLTFSVPMISTLHDLQHIHYPEFFSREELDKRAVLYKQAAVFAERVIVSFQHVKDDIVNYYGIPENKVDVCMWGVDRPIVPDKESITAAQARYGLKRPYLFYAANTWQHKNHLGLIRAFKVLLEKKCDGIDLVCTGQRVPSYFPIIENEIKRLGLEDSVKFTGYIPEADVRALLKGAALAVVPTLYEAGSFPLIEAMALEVPVICSEVTSLPDTIGDKRFVFDPLDCDGIADMIATMLKEESLRAENIMNSRQQINQYGWEKAAPQFIASYKKASKEFTENMNVARLKERMHAYELMSYDMNRRLKALRTDLNALLNSLSWRITAPLRTIAGLFIK